MKKLIALAALFAASCTTIVQAPAPSCSDFVPKRWAEKISGEPLPDFTYIDQVAEDYPELAKELEKREWQKWGLGNAGRLEQSENRREDTMTIIRTCEDNYQQAIERTEKRWYQFWK